MEHSFPKPLIASLGMLWQTRMLTEDESTLVVSLNIGLGGWGGEEEERRRGKVVNGL